MPPSSRSVRRVELRSDQCPSAILQPIALSVTTVMTGTTNPTGLSGQIAQWACWSTALTTTQQRIAYLLTKRGHPLRRA